MKKNMGNFDRIIRAVVAIALLIAYFADVLPGIWAIVGLIVIIAFVFTSAIGTCPIYLGLGLSTKEKENK